MVKELKIIKVKDLQFIISSSDSFGVWNEAVKDETTVYSIISTYKALFLLFEQSFKKSNFSICIKQLKKKSNLKYWSNNLHNVTQI